MYSIYNIDDNKSREIRGSYMKHPFATECLDKKCAYVLGIIVMAQRNNKLTNKQRIYIRKIFEEIALPVSYEDKLFRLADRYLSIESKMKDTLDTPYKKYYFLMELYQLFNQENTLEINLLDKIGGVLDNSFLTPEELEEVRQIQLTLDKENHHYIEVLNEKLVSEQKFLGEIELSHRLQATLVEISDKVIRKDEVFKIDKPSKIVGLIKVEQGGKLIIDNTYVEVIKPIQLAKGELIITKATITAGVNLTTYMFQIEEAKIELVESKFDGNDSGSIWQQSQGELQIRECKFCNTVGKPCINLWECSAIIRKSRFINCRNEESNGGAVCTNKNLEITSSTFESCCALKGAAIYRMTTSIPWIPNGEKKTGKRKTEEDKLMKLFGHRIDYIPCIKGMPLVPFHLVLKENTFVECKATRQGIVCLYTAHSLVNKNNQFEKCEGQNIMRYD